MNTCLRFAQRITAPGLVFCATLSAGCSGSAPSQGATDEPIASGKIAISAGAAGDIAGFQIDASRGSTLVSSTFVAANTSSDGGPKASTLITLSPGSYTITSTAMSAPGVPFADCTVASAAIEVQSGKTSAVTLNDRCQSRPGAVDVTTGANFEPSLTSVTVGPGTTLSACDRLTLTLEATDPDGDAISCDVAILPGSPTSLTPTAGSDAHSVRCSANIEPPAAGDHVLQIRACDALGCGSLDIPIHVTAFGTGACTPSCDDGNACTTDTHTPEGICQSAPTPDGTLCVGGNLHVKILGINDFHGQLDTGRLVAGRPVGGAAVLASYLEAARAGIEDQTILVHAGDQVGASPPASALLQDEPSIAFLNILANSACTSLDKLNPSCNIVGTLGNHEFDEGKGELLRLLNGGNYPSGPFLEDPYPGARFPYISANVIEHASGQPLLRPFVVKRIHGVPVGFIGAVLKETPTIVTPTGVAGLDFIDEADAINAQVPALHALGVHAIVVTIHQGGFQTSYTGPTRPASLLTSGPEITGIVSRLDDDIDLVVSGHTHAFTNALLLNQHAKQILVTQAFSASTAYDDIDLFVDPVSGEVVVKSASIVTTYGDSGPGLTPDPNVAQIVAAADAKVAPLVNQVFGTASVALTRAQNAAGESALGDLIADSQLAAMAPLGVQFAFMNPGGIRADLAAGEISFGDLFTIQPFGNTLVKLDMTGAQIIHVLEQQWLGQTAPRILQIAGFDYTWDPAAPVGSRIVEVRLGGVPIDPLASYIVSCNNFLATGGDSFTGFTAGLNQVGGPVDLDAFSDFVEHNTPITVPPAARIRNP